MVQNEDAARLALKLLNLFVVVVWIWYIKIEIWWQWLKLLNPEIVRHRQYSKRTKEQKHTNGILEGHEPWLRYRFWGLTSFLSKSYRGGKGLISFHKFGENLRLRFRHWQKRCLPLNLFQLLWFFLYDNGWWNLSGSSALPAVAVTRLLGLSGPHVEFHLILTLCIYSSLLLFKYRDVWTTRHWAQLVCIICFL